MSVRCSRCGRYFKDRNGAQQHVNMKHGGNGQVVAAPQEDREPSMGRLLAEAQIARASGEPVEDWIAEMFDLEESQHV